ncbi:MULTISPECIES: dihydrofolate reductase family protein [unclassified Roseateles]|uniref:dihydrofolate reductase family protein n=1 Tax=unclassified Roseateles TaxID=2626991 RepID=UPI0006FB8302|nr:MULTISPECIES: dihydrofolate reductase family protein [unclassified Roseateles]KQW44577.1 dihydrofolate reductase [Pelomonas sp. Root405]KRA69936.1 dihydrofolate reductase [Pelomonas sp. Root662]
MPQLIFSQLVSLDGFCAGPGGDLSRLPMGQAFDEHNLELLRTAGRLMFGRITFGMFRDYWPTVQQDPAAEPVQAAIAALVEPMPKLVVSDSLPLQIGDPWGDAEVVRRAQAHACIRALKQGAGGDLLAYGSHVLMNDLLAYGMVDELRVLIANVVLGEGVRTFEAGLPAPLRLVAQRRLAGSDIVMLRYALPAR